MGVGISIVGKVGLTGWVLGGADKTFAILESWFLENKPFALSRTWRETTVDGRPVLNLLVYPMAEPVTVVYLGRGRFFFEGKTSTLGPVYHFQICSLVQKMGDLLKLQWDRSNPGLENDLNPPRQLVFDAMNTFLSAMAERILELQQDGAKDIQIGLPGGEIFLTDEPLNTPAGPRDETWLVRAAKNAPACSDVFPLWDDAPGKPELGLAQALMWTEVRWIKPWKPEQEEVLRATLDLLERAYDLNNTLKFPWREWLEMLKLLEPESQANPKRELVEHHATQVDSDAPLIGYRRFAILRKMEDGWNVNVPGHFEVEHDGEGTLCLGDEQRSVRLTGLNISKAGTPVEPAKIIESKQFGIGDERVTFETENVMGAGSFQYDEEEGKDFFFGCVAARGQLQLVTVHYPATEDRQWAIEAWKSIDYPQPASL